MVFILYNCLVELRKNINYARTRFLENNLLNKYQLLLALIPLIIIHRGYRNNITIY